MWQLNHPSVLYWSALPLALAGYFLFSKKKTTHVFRITLSNPTILKKHAKTKWIFRSLFIGSILSVIAGLFAVSRPFQTKTWTKQWTDGLDIVLLLDVSESMEATDLNPTRILAAKSVIRDFISRRPNDRLGLVIFGGEAILKSPLTRDFNFLLSQVDDVRIGELKQGTAIGMGLANAITRLKKSESSNKVIILLTDGDSNVGAINPITAAHLAAQEDIKVYSIGIGKTDRVVVPIYAHDATGRPTQLLAQVPSYLNPELLKQIAGITGGKSYMARDTGALLKILQEIDKLEKTKIKVQPMSEREELFFIPGLIATLAIALYYGLTMTRYRVRPTPQLRAA